MTSAANVTLNLDVANDEVGRWLWLAGGRATAIVALELWDADAWHALVATQAQFARDTGALVQLQYALNSLAATHLFAGELTTATRLLDERRRGRGRCWWSGSSATLPRGGRAAGGVRLAVAGGMGNRRRRAGPGAAATTLSGGAVDCC